MQPTVHPHAVHRRSRTAPQARAGALAAGVLAATLLATPLARAGGVRYDLQLLPAAPGVLQSATGLNDSGVVVGEQRTRFGSAQPFRYDAGVLSALAIPGLLSARPVGISANGVIAGTGFGNGLYQAGVIGAGFTPIAGLPAGGPTQSFAQAIDPTGRMVAGYSIGTITRSWISAAGLAAEVPLMTTPVAINLAGQVAGVVGEAFSQHAALYSDGSTRDLGTLGGAASRPTGLNAAGTVVGVSDLPGGAAGGFVYDSSGGLRAARAAAGFDVFLPKGINDLGQIVGTGFNRSNGASATQLAAAPGASPVDLQPLINAGASDPLVDVVAINASGQIAGACGNLDRACLLTPTGTLAWSSTTGGSFDEARHWDSGLGFAPNRHLDVLIAPAAAVTVLARQGAEFKSLVVGTTTQGASQATLQLAQGARLVGTAATTRIERSGILMGDGVLAGGLVNRGTLQGTAATPLHITVEGTLDNLGLITGSGRINANLINRGSSPGVRVGAGEVLTIAGTAHSGADGSVLEVRHGGELRIEGNYTAQAGSFIRLDDATLRVTGLVNASTVQIGFGGASIFGDVANSPGSSNGRIIASGGSEVTFWGRVANHNEVRAAAGSHIVYFGDVTGAGSFTTQGAGAYHRFEAGYSPGGAGTAAVVEVGSAEFDGLLALDLAGTEAGGGADQVRFGGSVLFDTGARLALSLGGGASLQAGQRFQLFDYQQAPEGRFAALSLPTLAGGLAWDTSDLYAGGSVQVSSVPEPATAGLLIAGAALLCWRCRRQEPANRAAPLD